MITVKSEGTARAEEVGNPNAVRKAVRKGLTESYRQRRRSGNWQGWEEEVGEQGHARANR
jgi:hypothetical protein